jgi:hypothetical protein
VLTTTQHSTAQDSTGQHNTAQDSTATRESKTVLFTSDVSVDDVDELAAAGEGDAMMPGVDELADDPGHVAVEVPEVWVPVVEEEVVLVGQLWPRQKG